MTQSRFLPTALLVISAAALFFAGCQPSPSPSSNGSTPARGEKLAGELDIDGSSTVQPIMAALVEEFNALHPDVRITVAQAGTSAGMQKFERGEIEIVNASRPIKREEDAALAKAGQKYFEVPIAFDGLCVVVNHKNDWMKSITLEQLKRVWSEGSKITKWSQIDPSYPDRPLKLYGPSEAHGTYEYFNETINGDPKSTRDDYSKSADYNVLVAGVARDENALGYVGYAYYETNQEQMRAVPVDAGSGPVEPSPETIRSNQYHPLSRPLMFYVRADALEEPATRAFVNFALDSGSEAVKAAGYVPLPEEIYKKAKVSIENKQTGSKLLGAKPGESLFDLFRVKPGK